jgi:hypothetical protein
MSKSRGVERASARAAAVSLAVEDEDETQLVREEAALLPPVTGCVPFDHLSMSTYRRVNLLVRGRRPRARQQVHPTPFGQSTTHVPDSRPRSGRIGKMVVVPHECATTLSLVRAADKARTRGQVIRPRSGVFSWLVFRAENAERAWQPRQCSAVGARSREFRRPGDLWAPENHPSAPPS